MSNASFEDIPEELQIEILSRLPPESLSRCKRVSKHWKDTLTIKAFLLNQSLSYDKHPKLFFVAQPEPGTKGFNSILSFELTDNTHNTTIVTVPNATPMSVVIGYKQNSTRRFIAMYDHMSNICNDLICLFNSSSKSVGLLNVRTEYYLRLPAMTKELNADGFTKFWYALGFDPVNKVFKVLCTSDRWKKRGSRAAILTLGSKKWKPIENVCLPRSVTEDSAYWSRNNSFCLDGVIYWVNETKIGLYAIKLTVVAFDLNHETFRDYELFVEDAGTFRYYLTSLKGCPTLFIWKEGNDEIQQFTLFNHKIPNVAWNRRGFIAHGFPKIVHYGSRWVCVAGGSILLRRVWPNEVLFQGFVNVPNNVSWCPYQWYDLEKFALE